MRVLARLAALAAISAAALSMAGCSDDGPTASAADLAQSDVARASVEAGAAQDTGGAVQAFGADLYRQLAQEDGNLIFSPYSAAVALAMTRAGAEGETAEQMDAVLHAALAGDLHAGFNAIEQALAKRPGDYGFGGESVELELATANQLWGQRGFEFEPPFLDLLAAQYGAGMHLVDYVEATDEARAAINEWVAERTADRIPELIPDGVLDEMTRLVLTNAVYLKAPWLNTFEEGATGPAPFHRLDGSEVEAQMMRLSARTNYHAGDGYQAVNLPYVDGTLSMVVVVPDEGTFADFESTLDGARLDEVIGGLADAQVQLRLPSFEFRTQSELTPALSALGMPVAFTDAADFSAMSPHGDQILIQAVVHEAFIAVDEEGTEAAAATGVAAGVTSMPQQQVDLTVDRPFLFLIRDGETGALLFLGRVLDPTA